MAVIYFNVPGSFGGGGPSVFVAKTAQAFAKLGHKVIYDNPGRADVCIGIIETGKILRKIDRSKTKVVLRLDGIYNKEYNKLFNRAVRPDMTALHDKLKQDLVSVDWVVYQSQWSKDCIDSEIVERDANFSVIHNAVDTNLFKPMPRGKSIDTNLFHVGKMRNGYLMESLIGTYQELKKRGHKVKLILVGSMDGECQAVFNKYVADKNIQHLGSFSNTALTAAYNKGDIYIGPRQGSSSDNVIAEAQACGLPVVIPSFGGNTDMVFNDFSGVVVPADQWNYGEAYNNRLADGVERIMKDLDGFKARARQHAEKELSIDKMVSEYLKVMGI